MTEQSITWENCRVRLGDLTRWEGNPAEITRAAAARLVDSFSEFGQVSTLAIDPENRLIDGHQRLDVWMAKFGADFIADCRRASRLLTEQERRKIAVYLRSGAVGRYNWDTLANWDADAEELIALGFDKDTQKSWKRDINALDEFLRANGEDGNYTRKIEPPIYQITDKKPEINELFNRDKTDELIRAINNEPGLSDDERTFLLIASQRHTVFDFKNIAEYYAHSGIEMQRLMEQNALVIIDFHKAIELGFVELTKEISEIIKDEYGDD